jgi:hypothetical protein
MRVTARVDLGGLDTDNLVFYSFDRTTNRATKLDTTYTEFAGDIVISDGALTRK